MVGDLLQQSYHKSISSNIYYPIDDSKSKTETVVPTTPAHRLESGPGLRKTRYSHEEDSAKFSVPYLKWVLPESFGIGYNR